MKSQEISEKLDVKTEQLSAQSDQMMYELDHAKDQFERYDIYEKWGALRGWVEALRWVQGEKKELQKQEV